MNHLIAPSILSCDFGNLEREIELINNSEADWIHCDVMDGTFVPNVSIGFPIISAIKKVAKKPLDVHLMIERPEEYLKDFKAAGADILTIHYEGGGHLHRTVQAIQELGMKAGVAINPHTPVGCLKEVISIIDVALLMSVNPGFGGQKFIKSSIDKLKSLKELVDEKEGPAQIEVDGGVTLDNAKSIIEAGADVLVAGSTVFGSDDPVNTIKELKHINVNTIQV